MALVSAPSPTGKRQIVRRINKEDERQQSFKAEVATFSKLTLINVPKLGSDLGSKKPNGLKVITSNESMGKNLVEKPQQTKEEDVNLKIKIPRDEDDPFFHENGPSPISFNKELPKPTEFKKATGFQRVPNSAVGYGYSPGLMTRNRSSRLISDFGPNINIRGEGGEVMTPLSRSISPLIRADSPLRVSFMTR